MAVSAADAGPEIARASGRRTDAGVVVDLHTGFPRLVSSSHAPWICLGSHHSACDENLGCALWRLCRRLPRNDRLTTCFTHTVHPDAVAVDVWPVGIDRGSLRRTPARSRRARNDDAGAAGRNPAACCGGIRMNRYSALMPSGTLRKFDV